MTKEEAREAIKEAYGNSEYTDEIIKTLEQEPSYNSVNSLVEFKLKNPKAKTFDVLHFVADNAGLSTFEAIEKAYNMGVSKQELILDKIRAEIEQARQAYEYENADKEEALSWVLEVIDKYIGEDYNK